MPEKRHCTLTYLKAVLSGKKKCFKNAEVKPINVPRFKSLSLKVVFQHAKSNAQMTAYLPEQIKDDEPLLDREFLFTIVNTCDPTYFPRELKRIEIERQEAAQKAQADMIEVQPEMMELLASFGLGSNKTKSNARSLSLLKAATNPKKRSHAQAAQNNQLLAESSLDNRLPAKRFRPSR